MLVSGKQFNLKETKPKFINIQASQYLTDSALALTLNCS